jgi:uncharacterized protein (TIGR02594 family)
MANFKVTDGALNVRSGPSLLEKTVNVIQEGDIVKQLDGSAILSEVKEQTPSGSRTWMKLESGEFEGWVSLKNLTLQPNESFKVTNASGSNVRSEPLIPSSGTNVVGNLPDGSFVSAGIMVMEIDNPLARRWIRLDLAPGKSGWSSMLLLQSTTNSPALSQTKYQVTADALHVRSEPSLESSIIGNLALGATFLEGAITVDGDRSWMKITAPAGFVSMKFLSKVGTIPVPAGVPKWFAIAKGEEGIKEFTDARNNPEVVKYLKSCSKLGASSQRNDETAWCSAFVNWCVEKAGFEGTESAAARSWMNWGKSIAAPTVGCIVVLRRTSNPAFGHVGFWVKEQDGRVFMLGGNQSDSVNVTAFDKSRVLKNGFRMQL